MWTSEVQFCEESGLMNVDWRGAVWGRRGDDCMWTGEVEIVAERGRLNVDW